MNKQTLKLSDFYIKKTLMDEGYVRSDGSIDNNQYSLDGHTHSKNDINFEHEHGKISYNGTLTDVDTSNTATDRTDYILFADNSQNKTIKGTNKVSDYLITHSSSLPYLDIDNSYVTQNTINTAINAKVKTINESLNDKLENEDVVDIVNNIVDDYIPKTSEDEGFLKSNGNIDSNQYTKEGHTHQKNDITDFNHSHGRINNDGILMYPETLSTIIDSTDYILFADNDDDNIIKGANKINDSLMVHSTSLEHLGINNGYTTQNTINEAINTKVGVINNTLSNKVNTTAIENIIRSFMNNNLIYSNGVLKLN